MSLSLDSTGALPANLVTGEVHAIDTTQGPLILSPSAGLFYSKGFKIDYTDADGDTRTLSAGSDYSFLYSIQGVIQGNPIFAAIAFDTTKLTGSLSITYHALGGKWQLHQADINQKLKSLDFNPQIAYYALVTLQTYYNTNLDPIELDSFAALQAVQTQAAGQNVLLTLGVRTTKRGSSINPTGSNQFDSLRGFDAAQCLAFVIASDGIYLPLDSLAHDYTYDGNGNMLTNTVAYGGVSYRKTYTYTGGRLSSETAWEAV